MTLVPPTRSAATGQRHASPGEPAGLRSRGVDRKPDHSKSRAGRSMPGTPGGAPADTNRTHTIGEIAKEFGVTLRTLRFYEDRRLLTPRRDGTTRIYDARDKARLATILRGKALGFTLTEIQAMIAAEEGGSGQPSLKLSQEQIAAQIEHLKRQRDEIDQALAELQAAQH